MTVYTLNEVENLINKQENDIEILKAIVEVSLGSSFLENNKTTIHYYLCVVDDYVERIKNNNKEIIKNINIKSGN